MGRYYLYLFEDVYNENNEFTERGLGVLADSQRPQLDGAAFEIKFTPNINGLHKLSFKMPAYFFDKTTQKKTVNPRYKGMTNERKVRLYKDGEYYDFVIKEIIESHETNNAEIVEVSCQDAVIDELAKKGWALVFDEENGMGTIQELGPKVLEGTDWVFDVDNTDTLFETDYYNDDGQNAQDEDAKKEAHKQSYTTEQGTRLHYTGSRNQLGIAGSPDTVEVIRWDESEFVETEVGRNFLTNGVSFYTTDHWTAKSGNLLVKHQENGTYTRYLALSGRSPVYNNSLDSKKFRFTVGQDYTFLLTHRGPATTYTVEISDEWGTHRNVVTRQSFSVPSSSSWKTFGFSFTPKITGFYNLVHVQSSSASTVNIGKVRLELGALNGLYNSDFRKGLSGWALSNIGSQNYGQVLKNYEYRDFVLKTNRRVKSTATTPHMLAIDGKDISSFSADIKGDQHGSIKCTLKARKGSSTETYTAMLNHGVSFSRETATFQTRSLSGYDNIELTLEPEGMVYITNLKFESGENTIWTPAMEDEIVLYPYSPLASYITRKRYAYLEGSAEKPITLTTKQENTLEKILEVPEKVRTLQADRSNCFNLLQSLAELFEAWPVYTIERNEDGTIKRDRFTNKRVKKISFKQDPGRELPFGIEYSKDLSSISRTVDSSEIITKMFVENSEFEHAQDGIVSIAQAHDNPSGEIYILNLGYYIEMGILPQRTKFDVAEFEAKIKVVNIDLDREARLRNELQNEMFNSIIPQLSATNISVTALEESIRSIEHQLGGSAAGIDMSALREQKTYYQQLLSDAKLSQKELVAKERQYEKQIDDINKKIDQLMTNKRAVEMSFIEKYSPYIHEGAWSDDSYVNPDMYFRDALSVSRRSAYPQIEYNIKTIGLSSIEGYEYREYQVGDKTFVLDYNMFLHEEGKEYKPAEVGVFISEIEYVLDNPSADTITVTNFTTRFEEIFQRIIASVESLRMNEKVYNRAKNFKENGEMDKSILQNTLDRNNIAVARSQDGTVEINSQGITVADKQNPLRMVKMIPGGIYITKDGVNWKAGLTPDGLSIDELTAGVINTENIQIYSETQPRFFWDANGLTAYGLDRENKTDFNTRITFNHDGLIFRRTEDPEEAELSLTWDGLAMNLQDGAVKIGSSAGIVVEDNQKTPIKRVEIGKINRTAGESMAFHKDNPTDITTYGMVLRNEDGMETMVTSDGGELWLMRALSIGDQGTQDMAGITGISTYKQREIESFIRNYQYYMLGEAQKSDDETAIAEWTEKITSPISSETFQEFKTELEEDPIRFWSGSNTPNKATFKVLQSGKIFATNAVIKGDVTATSGHFSGRIYMGDRQKGDVPNTGAGLSGDPRDKVRIWAGAPLTDGQRESDPDTGLFKVYNNGRVYATNMDVHGLLTTGEKINGEYSPTFFISGEQHEFSGNLKRHTVDPNLMARMWAGGDTPNKANLVITSDGALYGSDVHLSGAIEGEGLKVANVRIDDSGIYTKNYSPGALGAGWFIRNDGTADFQNVRVRGEISSTVFAREEIQAAGGSILVRPSTILETDSISVNARKNVEFEVSDIELMEVGDFLLFSEEEKHAKLQIVGISGKTISAKCLSGGGTFLKGAPLVNFGTDGSGGILIAAKGTDTQGTSGSVVDLYETVDETDDFSERLLVRLGDLSNIPDSDLPNEGFGLFAENASLRGNLFMTRAGMYNGDEFAEGENRVIRIWAGADFAHRGEANFKVYEDGTVLARNGIFEGKIIADEGGFSGSVGLGGITINDSTGSFYIEKRSGNTDEFNTIATFSSDGVTIYDGGIRVFKSGEGVHNTYQYIYPYMFAVNDTDADNERIVTRQAHFWSFDKEDEDTPEGEIPKPSMNYSIRTNKASFEFTQGLVANQDKAPVSYLVNDFSVDTWDGFLTYVNDESKVSTEKSTSYLAITQKDPLKNPLFDLEVQDYKAVTSESGEREYELEMDIEVEYDNAEEAYLIIEYVPNAKNVVPEILKYELPKIKDTPRTIFKNLRVYNYGPNDKLKLNVYVENTKSAEETNNRLLIHEIRMTEITIPVLIAEEDAYGLIKKSAIGLNANNQLEVETIGDRDTVFVSRSVEGVLGNMKVGINNESPTVALDVTGDQKISGNFTANGGIQANTATFGTDSLTTLTGEKIRISGTGVTSTLELASSLATGEKVAPMQILFSGSSDRNSARIAMTQLRDYVTGELSDCVSFATPEWGRQNVSVSGDIFQSGGVRVPVTRYGSAAPSNGLYPDGPKNGDLYIRW